MKVVCGTSKGQVLAAAQPTVLAGLGVVQTQCQTGIVTAERLVARGRFSSATSPHKTLSFVNLEPKISA